MTTHPRTDRRRRGRQTDDNRLHPVDDWQYDVIRRARHQHDTTRAEETEDPW